MVVPQVIALALLCSIGAASAAAGKQTFAVFGDWGRSGGNGSSAYKGTSYNPNVAKACPKHTGDPFYISITPVAGVVDGSGPYDKKPNDPCVVKACNNLGGGDARENCEGKIQQLQAAWHLDRTCRTRGCEFIINTSDNFYALGCNATANPGGGSCADRFQSDWIDVYKTPHTPSIQHLKWYSSLGNHDVLGGIQGVNEQIAYTKKHPGWYLPARWYATTIGKGSTAINLVVAHTSVFIDGYLTDGSSYAVVDEEIHYSTPAQRARQLKFLDTAMAKASKKQGWFIVLGHHPGFSGDQSFFDQDFGAGPESSAWKQFSDLVKKYKPVAYVNGHDHAIDYSKPAGYATQFFTSGAGSFTEPNDGGWNKTTGTFRYYKPMLKYSNVRMSDGGSFTGNIIMEATPSTLRAELFSIRSGTKSEYLVSCKKSGSASNPYTCSHSHGQVKATFSQK